MLTRALLMGAFFLLAMADMARADDWILAPGQGTLARDKTFSDQVTEELDSRGLDWGPWTALTAVENPGAVPTAGKRFVSPDHLFSVQTELADSAFYFVIKDEKTGSITRLACDTFPVLALGWSPDSKSLVAVVHEPMTSFIKVIHWNGSAWDPHDVDAPEGGDDDKFHVVGWKFVSGHIEATYIVDHAAGNGASPVLYQCRFQIDPANGSASKVIKTPISQKEFISLRNGGN